MNSQTKNAEAVGWYRLRRNIRVGFSVSNKVIG
jgi:hypothetical protein